MVKQFAQGETLFREGEVGSEAYLIKAGQLSVWRERDGARVHLALKCEGDVVGEMSLIDDTECSASVSAETDVEVEVITHEDMEGMLAASPEVLPKIVHQLMESLRTANDLVSMYSAQQEG